jgi:putative phosphoesterase
MKFAVFSDIHGNADALKQMLKDLEQENISGYICCGDIAGYYYDQEETVDILKSLENLRIVRGNHDYYYMKAFDDPTLERLYAEKYGAGYHYKSRNVLDFIHSLPVSIEAVIDNRNTGIFHGEPQNPMDGRIYPDCKEFHNSFQKYQVCFLGHTHYRFMKKVGNVLIINPGSLGQPRDGRGFSYCIFDLEKMNCDFRSVLISKDLLKEKITKNETRETVKKYLINILDRGEDSE